MSPRRATVAYPAPLAAAGAFLLGLLFLAGCSGPKYPKCENDDHCAEKVELCVEGTCQQCRAESDCGEGQQCAGGRCVEKPECASASDCPDGRVCRSGKCKVECSSAADCGSGLKCMGNRCVDRNSCNSGADCPEGSTCEGGMCTTQISRSLSTCSFPTVRFDFNESNLSSDVQSGLREAADCISEAGGTLRIEGHADERGTEEYNLALGDRRARAVMDYLVRLGVSSSKLRPVSMGETQPLVDASTESAWAKNRRAELIPE